MALDTATANRLWKARYEKQLRDYAFKNKYLDDAGDPEDLFQDMAIGVWMKAVKNFEADKTTFAGGDVDRAFNAFFTTILNQFLANKSSHRDTGKQQWERSQKSLDAPVKKDEEGGASLIDLVEQTREQGDPDLDTDIQRLLHALPDNLAEPLKFIIEHADRGNMTQVMNEIREKGDAGDANFQAPNGKGWTQQRLYNELINEPEFVEFFTAL